MFVKRYHSPFQLKCLPIVTSILFTILSISIFAHLVSNIVPTDIATVTKQTKTAIERKRGSRRCVPYTAADPRPFFERDFPQLNIPQRMSTKSDDDIARELRSLRLLILATARNVENQIDQFRKSTEVLIGLFHPSSFILICESDSSDNTVKKISAWPRVELYTYGNLSDIYPERTERIAFCRNKLLNVARQISADYILMTDADLFAANIPSLLSNFRYNRDEWSVMTTNSNVYYDIWALRTLSDSVLNFDVWQRIWQLSREKKYCDKSVSDQLLGNHQRLIPFERGLVEVRSAFNGAALYKANATNGCYYSGANSTCEHVPFHLCIRDKNHGRIFINPEFLVY